MDKNKKPLITERPDEFIKSVIINKLNLTDIPEKDLIHIKDKMIEYGAQTYVKNKKQNPLNFKFINRTGEFSLSSMIFGLVKSFKLIKDLIEKKEKVLFVITKNAGITEFVEQQCNLNDQLFVTKRWLGGILTNFKTIKKSIMKLNDLEKLEMTGDIKKYVKKEQIEKRKEILKMNGFIGGIKKMDRIPKLVVIFDPALEYNTIAEANDMGCNIIGISNINSNPNLISYNIPLNTRSKKSA
jgi:small subunit ribosomal protein S2